MDSQDAQDTATMIKWILLIVVILLVITAGGMWGCPTYSVYKQKMDGEAEYAQAVYSKRVKILEAVAAESSAIYTAHADTIRAHGVAQSNAIIGQSLKDNEAYLRWLYVDGMKENKNATYIYVPTEAQLPILEARRGMPTAPKSP
jgi:uncharacterized protein YxeA